MAKEREKPAKTTPAAVGPELRLVDRRAFIGFPPLEAGPGVTITDFGLQIPDVTFPFNVSGGPSRYQKRKLNFGFLELSVDAEVVLRRLGEISLQLMEIADLRLNFRVGYLEGQGRLASGERTPFTFKLAFDADREKLAFFIYDVRMYGFASTPSAQLPVVLSRTVQSLGVLPEVEIRGATGFSARVLAPLVQLAAVTRGYKMPALDYARLSAAEITPSGLRLRFSAGGLAPPAAPDEDLLLAMEGSRAFAEAEELISRGQLAEARQAYLKHGDLYDAHPFAAERLLSLMVADPQAHELALDLTASLSRRRDRSAAAIWAEAVVRERRGESARAAERYLALCAHARRNSEEASAFFAAESAARVARDEAPQMAVKALHELLGLRPDHLPSLQALARAADRAQDRAGAIRAYRRIAALARDTMQAAEAHVQLARLCAITEDDIAGSRLHCEAALKLAPDHPDALYQLGELCHRAGDHLRAIKSLDRLREVALGRHEIERVGRAALLAGQVWEDGLEQIENALLRYREAVSLMPGEPEPLAAAGRAAEKLGKVQEAVASYLQAIELAGPAPATESVRKAVHQARHAMARLSRTHLAEPSRAHQHLEAALALDPRDVDALEELVPYFRATGKADQLADALEKAAAVAAAPERRAAFWAEAGELYRSRLGRPEHAEKLLASALEADRRNKLALEGMLALSEARRDGPALCRTLKSIAELTADPKERVRYLRRLAVAARDLTFDLDLAAHALLEVHTIEPDDLPILGELSALQRRRGDIDGLAKALEFRASAAEAHGDHRLAAAALRELAQVLEARLGRLGEALVSLEKAARLSPDPSILLDLADLSIRCERPANARRALEDLLLAQPAHVSAERSAEIRAKLGKACDLLGDKESAKEHYARAFPLRKLDAELGQRLEVLYEQSGQAREAADLWAMRAQALIQAQRNTEAAPLFLRSARALLRLGARPAALLRLQAALDAAPEGPAAAEILGDLADLELDRGGKAEAARLMARRAALLSDSRAAAKLLLEAAGLSAGTPRELELVAMALERDNELPAARVRRAELRLEREPGLALQDFESALGAPASDPDAPTNEQRLSLRRRAFEAALKADHLEAARMHLAAYVSERPDDLAAQKELAKLHRQAGAKDALFELLGQLRRRLPPDEQRDCLREYAELSLEVGTQQSALDALQELLLLDSGDAWAARTLYGLLGADSGLIAPELELSLLSSLLSAATGPERVELWVRRAKLQRRQGDLENARKDLERAASESAEAGPLWIELAQLAQEAGNEKGELAAWRKAAAVKAGISEAAANRILALAKSFVRTGDYSAARDAFSTALTSLADPPQRQEAWSGLADAALRLNDKPAAAAALLEASKEGSYRQRAEALSRRAAILEEVGDVAEAAQSFEQALALAPTDEEALAGLKRTLRNLGNWEALVEVLSSEAARKPRQGSGSLYEEIGLIYLDRLSLKGPAEAAFRTAAQLKGATVEVRRRLISLLLEKGDFEEAVSIAEEAAQSLPAAEAAGLLRQTAKMASSADSELKTRLLRRAHALSPAKDSDLEELSQLLYVRGALSEAFELTSKLAERLDFRDRPDSAEAALLRLADLAEQLGQPETAEAALRRLRQERPLSREGAERLSRLLSTQSPRESIQVLWDYAQASTPSSAVASLLIALAQRAHAELLDADLATRMLLRAAEISPDPLPPRLELARIYEAQGRTIELAKELEQIASLALARGDFAGATAAYERQVNLAESLGHFDDALRGLENIRELCEDSGRSEQAALCERRRAEILRDVKRDFAEAGRAFKRSFDLNPTLEGAQLGAGLAAQLGDFHAEVEWLQRASPLLQAPADRAQLLLRIAQLFDGPLQAPSQAEECLREALALDPESLGAETLLTRILSREERPADLAAFWEERAQHQSNASAKAKLLERAARAYRDEAGNPEAAVSALLAARAATPDDIGIIEQTADLLYELGRVQEASEFDEALLRLEPTHPRIFERRASFLLKVSDYPSLGELFILRASKSTGPAAAESYLRAADAFRRAGAQERALLCESLAFETAPEHDAAFSALRARLEEDPRRLAEVIARRAEAVPEKAADLLRERAQRLIDAQESLLAAEALDDLLRIAPEDTSALALRAELAADAGGALAAQPFDRRLLNIAGESLAAEKRVRLYLRLGNAALASGAYQDAADALGAAVALDPSGPRGREALSLLSEVHARLRNVPGLYQTSIALAQAANPEEAEALLRRAASLFEREADAIDALLPLARLRPADISIVERAVAGLEQLGRYPELVELLSRSAEAIGGPAAAQLLLRAGRVLQDKLGDSARSALAQLRAAELDPTSLDSLRLLVKHQRERGDRGQLARALTRLLEAGPSLGEASAARLELAQLAEAEGDSARAAQQLERVVAQGRSADGYDSALERLSAVLERSGPSQRLAEVLRERADLTHGESRARLLSEASRTYALIQQPAQAADLARSAAEIAPTGDRLVALATLWSQAGDHRRAASAWIQSAGLSAPSERGQFLLKAADAYAAAGDAPESRELFEQIRQEFPTLLAVDELADRLAKAGAPHLALERSYQQALDATDYSSAIQLALAAQDQTRVLSAISAAVNAGQTSGIPPSATAFLKGLFSHERQNQRFDAASSVGRLLLALERDPRARSALHLELAELALVEPATRGHASDLFERALAEDPENTVALKHLVRTHREAGAIERFVPLAERLQQLGGPSVLSEADQQMLIDAYVQAGRKQEALKRMSVLPGTEERLRQRAALAAELGLEGESLQLREALAVDRSERETILTGYLERDLIPFSIRLANQLMAEGPLQPETSRLLAERLAASVEGPALAAGLWPTLLRNNVWDPDGWTLYAEALRRIGRDNDALVADGFGAALTASDANAPMPSLRPIDRNAEIGPVVEDTNSLVPIAAESMPRLHATLQPALQALGAPSLLPYLDPYGGSFAYLLSNAQLVLGAGALGCFGPTEIVYVTALALSLGPQAALLGGMDAIDGFDDAACVAFDAVPSSLAASRVVAILDRGVRGSDPKLIDRPAVLRSSLTFQRIALRALEWMTQ